jgi:hypothetical protein
MSLVVAPRDNLRVSASTYTLVLALGAGALAVWVDARFPNLFAADWRVVFGHVFASVGVVWLAMPWGIQTVIGSGVVLAYPTAAISVALPAIMYMLLASLWVLKLAQRMLPGSR